MDTKQENTGTRFELRMAGDLKAKAMQHAQTLGVPLAALIKKLLEKELKTRVDG